MPVQFPENVYDDLLIYQLFYIYLDFPGVRNG